LSRFVYAGVASGRKDSTPSDCIRFTSFSAVEVMRLIAKPIRRNDVDNRIAPRYLRLTFPQRHSNRQTCGPEFFLPRSCWASSAAFCPLFSIRMSDDHFERKFWPQVLYASRLASSVGVWPWVQARP